MKDQMIVMLRNFVEANTADSFWEWLEKEDKEIYDLLLYASQDQTAIQLARMKSFL